MAVQMHHGPQGPPPPGSVHYGAVAPSRNINSVNEALWMQIGKYRRTPCAPVTGAELA